MLDLPNSNPMRPVLLSLLIFEVIVFGLAVPVMIFIAEIPAGAAAGFGGGAALLALVSAALMRRAAGYPVAWFTQLVGVSLGFILPAMFAVGGMFLALWILTFVLGRRLEARRA